MGCVSAVDQTSKAQRNTAATKQSVASSEADTASTPQATPPIATATGTATGTPKGTSASAQQAVTKDAADSPTTLVATQSAMATKAQQASENGTSTGATGTTGNGAGASTPAITFLSMDDVASDSDMFPGMVVHVKGFGRRIDYVHETIAEERQSMLAALQGVGTVVWDGDSLNADSFTALIPDITPRPASFVAFLKRADRERKRFVAAWTKFAEQVTSDGARFTCVLCDGIESYEQLGNVALLKTKAQKVHVFGVGPVVEKEMEMAPSEVEFVKYRVHR
eukprot:m.20161 g.20161  ORF g.20161 m.20161 type:complete len:280 (+) comp6105_c0_seq2:262-1101(+)